MLSLYIQNVQLMDIFDTIFSLSMQQNKPEGWVEYHGSDHFGRKRDSVLSNEGMTE